ncbi:MAG TPA: amino acid adenylation domain-containing protein, partial [Polyangiales bacterium]|nr:amino acid adenylation domain-containing protein [Polyangiales bacterium]
MSERLSPQQRVSWDFGREARHTLRVRIGAREPAALAALERVVAQHDILRTRFVQDPRLKYPEQLVEDGERVLTVDFEGEQAVLSLPALCGDAASLRLLVEAWDRALRGAQQPDDPISYEQFAAWQNDLTPEARVSLRDAPALPYEAAEGEGSYHTLSAELPAATVSGLRQLARGCEVRLEAVTAALFAALLGRLSGRDEVVFALEHAGRDFDDVRGLLGPVARWQPVSQRAAFDREALRGMERTLSELDEDDAPLADHSVLPRALGFAFRSFLCTGGLQIEHATIVQPGPRHVLAVHETAAGMAVQLRYDHSRLADSSARVWLAQYTHGLGELVDARLPLRLRFERRVTSAFASATYEPLQQAFARHARMHPERMALVCGDEQLHYGELAARVNGLAHQLGAVAPGTPIGLWAERNASTIVGLLAILQAGGAYVPLDPEAPRERLRQQLTGLSKLIAREKLDLPLEVITESAARADAKLAPTHPEQLASMIFTSGSTGAPKAVMITERGIASYTHSILGLLALPEGMHFGTVSTLSADLGNTSVFAALASGGCLHVIDYATATDGARFAAYCARWPLDVLKIVPSHLAALLDAAADVLPARALLCGGEALSPALRRRVAALAPELALYNHYGPTETTVGALALPLDNLREEPGCSSIPIGSPLPSAQAFVIDAAGELTATGVTGELYLGGDGLARGYFTRADLTAERFVPHPFAHGERLYRTGDHARYRPDGTIEFLGRRDHQLKIRGFRVELGEIEVQLAQFPGCRSAAVLARPSATGGHTLTGFMVAERAIDEPALRRFLSERLPDYMIPSELVTLRELPRNRNGKLDREQLARHAEQRAQRSYRAPSNETERVLCALWSELLNVPRVGIDDDFFALGGHSLLAIPLIHRIREALGGALPLQAIFEAPTVAGLARALQRGSVHSLRAQGSRTPLFCFDPTGRHAEAYRALAEQLPDRPLHVLSSAGLDGLAEALVQHAPGPYQLLGWSLGGVLALATARALEQQGHELAFLGVLDCDPRVELYAHGEPDAVLELTAYLTQAEGDALRAQPTLHVALRAALSGLEGPAR